MHIYLEIDELHKILYTSMHCLLWKGLGIACKNACCMTEQIQEEMSERKS